MKTLLKNGNVLNVFTKRFEKNNVLIENDRIIGIGDYYNEADLIIDCENKYITPGLIDSHMHIESTTMLPKTLASVLVKHGTTSVICDPHEIANVCGINGIKFMLDEMRGSIIDYFMMIPSCVPATKFDESFAELNAEEIKKFFKEDIVLGLAEVMDYVSVINNDGRILDKINLAKKYKKIIDGHAPILNDEALDKYLEKGIRTDHEITNLRDGIERINKGEFVQIREGSAAKNLEALVDLFDYPYNSRCLIATDDIHPIDLINKGHINYIIKKAESFGKNIIDGLVMATLNVALCYNLNNLGAIAPGYLANICIFNDLKDLRTWKTLVHGKIMYDEDKPIVYDLQVKSKYKESVLNSVHTEELHSQDFHIDCNENNKRIRVMKVLKDSLITDELILDLDFSKNNGIDTSRDILKIALVERHKQTGHKFTGFINGIGLKSGAIATSVGHDSHNIVIVGTSEESMAKVGNHIREIGGGFTLYTGDGFVDFELPYAGLMSDKGEYELAELNERLVNETNKYGNLIDSVYMHTAFLSLPVIPHLKITTRSYVDVDKFVAKSLFDV